MCRAYPDLFLTAVVKVCVCHLIGGLLPRELWESWGGGCEYWGCEVGWEVE